jgi:replicative DNA helicase
MLDGMEVTVLGAMILDSVAVMDATAKLVAMDFSLDSHQRIYQAILDMTEVGESVDLLTVMGTLNRRKELDAIGGAAYLAFLTEGIPRNPNIESYVQTVLDRSLARRGSNLCQIAQQRLLDGSEAAAEVLDDLSKELNRERPEDSMTAAQVMPLAMQALHKGGTVIPTGISELDSMLQGGLRTKELIIIGAQPSAGKSALARQFERSAIEHGFGVHTHSIEVPKETWMLFHAAHLHGVDAWKLREPKALTPAEFQYLQNAAGKISQWNYMIDDAGSVHINQLLAKSRLTCQRRGIKLYTVDYLQLLSGDEDNRARLMGNAARRLKQFAKDNDVAVVLLSQLTRRGDINAKPTVQDLKESGDIEAAADAVLLNFRPKDLDTMKYTGLDEIILGKQRNGPTGSIPMQFDWKSLTFRGRTDGGYY